MALDKAIALARVASQNALLSNSAILNALPRIRDMSPDDGLFLESLMPSLTSATPKATQCLRAFVEKRTEKLAALKD
jgi:hypothetical protein